jgi:hypothetical protein
MVSTATPINLHQPLPAFVLNCPPKESCEIEHDATATITLDSSDKHGWAGRYEVTWGDGTKRESRFVAIPLKQKFRGCL